jgi:hypothetical protein
MIPIQQVIISMLEWNLTINAKQRTGYFNKRVVDALGTRLKMLVSGRALVAYPEGEDPEIILRSLEVIIKDLEIRRDLEKTASAAQETPQTQEEGA